MWIFNLNYMRYYELWSFFHKIFNGALKLTSCLCPTTFTIWYVPVFVLHRFYLISLDFQWDLTILYYLILPIKKNYIIYVFSLFSCYLYYIIENLVAKYVIVMTYSMVWKLRVCLLIFEIFFNLMRYCARFCSEPKPAEEGL